METSPIRLGLVCFGSDTGLGLQTRAYYEHLQPSKVMVVDLSEYNHMPVHREWYPDAWRIARGFPADKDCDEFVRDIDCLFVAETPLNYRLFNLARQRGVKTVLAYNYEFLDYLTAAEQRYPRLPRPDVFLAPTQWNIQHVQRVVGARNVQHLPLPIDVAELPQRTITTGRRFFHIAGRPAVHDRNGTLDYIRAVRMAHHLMPDAEFTLYCQQPTPEIQRELAGSPINLVGHVDRQADMYLDGDVLVLPRRYGGLCLPAQEAVGCGIPVLMPNISPNNSWMSADWMIPVSQRLYQFTARSPITVYSVDVRALAQRMVDLYRNGEKVVAMHHQAQELAQTMSWEALLPKYEEVLTPKEVMV